ncbi:unnamed protein product, partial [Polarella glacialis]
MALQQMAFITSIPAPQHCISAYGRVPRTSPWAPNLQRPTTPVAHARSSQRHQQGGEGVAAALAVGAALWLRRQKRRLVPKLAAPPTYAPSAYGTRAVVAEPNHRALDREGRRWETLISRIGPPLSGSGGSSSSASKSWRRGDGQMRVACYEAGHVTAVALHEEILCIGTRRGVVRTIDVESGAKIGDYFLGSHMPPAAIAALHFDGSAVAVGDVQGNIHVWRAQLPGSWGFTHSADWVMRPSESGGVAHSGGVTGLTVLPTGCMVSCGKDGAVTFWDSLGESREVLPIQRVDLGPGKWVLTLCASMSGDAVYAGLSDGSVYRVDAASGSAELLELAVETSSPVTALAVLPGTDALLIGRADGSIQNWKQGEAQQPEMFSEFHTGAIRHLSIKPCNGDLAPLLISTSTDGRAGVWDVDAGKPLWGLRGLSGASLVACGDQTRFITNGVIVNRGPEQFQPSRSWK